MYQGKKEVASFKLELGRWTKFFFFRMHSLKKEDDEEERNSKMLRSYKERSEAKGGEKKSVKSFVFECLLLSSREFLFAIYRYFVRKFTRDYEKKGGLEKEREIEKIFAHCCEKALFHLMRGSFVY